MFRRLLFSTAVVALASVTVFTSKAFAAAEERAASPVAASPAVISALMQPALLAEASALPIQMSMPRPVVKMNPHTAAKMGMGAVYASTALMHILDVDSTLKALKRGAVEANPLMSGVVHNKAAFFATKAAIAGASIYATSRMAKHNKLGAIITSSAINSAYLMIVRNNYAIANR